VAPKGNLFLIGLNEKSGIAYVVLPDGGLREAAG
jgi:hypothetical protein